MLLKIYSVYDEKAGAYLPPFYMQNDAVAVRAFRNSVQDEEHNFHKNAEDYTLFRLGAWDDNTGETVEEIEAVASGRHLKGEIE